MSVSEDINYSKTLKFSSVVKIVFLTLKSSVLLYIAVIFAVCYLADSFASEIETKVLSSVLNLIDSNDRSQKIKELITFTVYWISLYLMLTASITRVTFDTIQHKQETATRSDHIERYFEYSKTIWSADFVKAVFRCLGVALFILAVLFPLYILLIVLIFYCLAALGFVNVADAFFSIETMSLLSILILLIYLPIFYIFAKLSMAIPITIIDKLKVFESIRRSWKMTKSIWRKLFGQFVVFSVLLSVVIVVAGILVDLLLMSFDWTLEDKLKNEFVESTFVNILLTLNIVVIAFLTTVQFSLIKEEQEKSPLERFMVDSSA